MLRNTKAHGDPLCVSIFILVLIAGGFISWLAYSGEEIIELYITAFAGLLLFSLLIHLFHHGITPISGFCSLILFLVSVFMLRASLGTPTPAIDIFYNNVGMIFPFLIALDAVKTFVG
jgi:hypothetical protein